MKTFLAIVLIFCVGCGVSEQEKLAKRLNDKMDRAEAVERIAKPRIDTLRAIFEDRIMLERIAGTKIKKINLRLEFEDLTPDEKIQLLRDRFQVHKELAAAINKLDPKGLTGK